MKRRGHKDTEKNPTSISGSKRLDSMLFRRNDLDPKLNMCLSLKIRSHGAPDILFREAEVQRILFRLFGVALVASRLWSQSDLSTIRGVAVDASGAVVPNLNLTLLDIDRNTSRTAMTAAEGTYEIPFISPGLYKLTATGAGFKD